MIAARQIKLFDLLQFCIHASQNFEMATIAGYSFSIRPYWKKKKKNFLEIRDLVESKLYFINFWIVPYIFFFHYCIDLKNFTEDTLGKYFKTTCILI